MEKKLPEFKPLPELGNVASNYMSAFNVGMNIYEALVYLQGYVQITYNSMDDLINDWNNFETYITENINQIANEKTQEILNQWLSDGTLNNLIAQNPMWNQKANKDDLPPQENWLDNADFKSGIINQRGQTTYAGKTGTITYTIDRWWVSKSTSAMLSVNNDYISVSLPSLQSVGQYIDFEPNGEMTIVVKLRNNDLKVFTLDNYTNNIDVLVYNFGDIDTDVSIRLSKYSTDDKWSVSIYNGSGSTKEIDIEYIKLEKGSVYTGMPQWDFTLEWFNCQRYLYTVVGSIILNARYDGSNLCINFKTPMSFVNKPSIIHNNATFGVTSFNGSYENYNVSDFTLNTYDGGNINIIKPSSNPSSYGMAIVINGFYLDAETY